MHISKSRPKRKWLRRSLIAVIVLLLFGAVSVEVMWQIAQKRGVTSVDFPMGSEIQERAKGADYVDAYETEADSVSFSALREAHQLAPDDDEVVYEGNAPGLRYMASYHFGSDGSRHITLSTAVFYESKVGPAYFFFVRPVHRRLVPFMVSQLGTAK